MRRRHFPPARNHIPAHLTLFHKLPGAEQTAIAATLRRTAERAAAFAMEVRGLRFLGFGVAYDIRSPDLDALRADLAATWKDWLTPQDAQGFRAHITIQNKAKAEEAKALHEALAGSFQPFFIDATALLLWHYRGGPWEAAGRFAFGHEDAAPSI